MSLLRATAFLLFVPSLLPAQASVTLPKGLASKEGSSLFALTNRRMQGGDATQIGRAGVFKSWALRRDGRATISRSGGTVDVTLQIGTCNIANLTSNMNGNFTGTPTTVFQKTGVKFPDWTKAPGTPPAAFDFVLPFNKTHIYLGKQAILWDLNLAKLASNLNRCDRQAIKSNSSFGAVAGPGCGTFRHSTRLINSGAGAPRSGMQATISVQNAPVGKPVLLSADLKVSGLTIRGWCAPIYALPTFLLPLGKSKRLGAVAPRQFAFPYIKSAEGLTIATQAVSTNALGIALSNGRATKMPTSPGRAGIDSAYVLGAGVLSPSLINSVFYNTGLVVQLK